MNKEIARLYYSEKMPMRKVAAELGYSVKTIKTRLHDMQGNRSIQEEWILKSSDEYSQKITRILMGSHRAKLTESDVLVIRDLYCQAMLAKKPICLTQIELSEKFGVSKSTISSIVKRRSWRHI